MQKPIYRVVEASTVRELEAGVQELIAQDFGHAGNLVAHDTRLYQPMIWWPPLEGPPPLESDSVPATAVDATESSAVATSPDADANPVEPTSAAA